MSLTPELFNLLLTKQDAENFVTKEHFDEKMDKLMDSIDSLTKVVENFSQEQTTNIAAHDRIQQDVKGLDLRVKKLEGASI